MKYDKYRTNADNGNAGKIDSYTTGKGLGELWQSLGIQLLFGVAFVCVGLAPASWEASGRNPDAKLHSYIDTPVSVPALISHFHYNR